MKMHLRGEMQELVKEILRCSSDPNGWEGALDCFNAHFGLTASCMFSVHEFENMRMDFSWSEFFRTNLTDNILHIMQTGGETGDKIGYETLFKHPAQKFLDELELFQVDRIDQLPPSNVREFTQSVGIKMRAATALNKQGPWLDGLFCQHATTDEWRGFKKQQDTGILLPIIANTVSIGRVLQQLRDRYDAALSVLDALGLGVFLVDERGCVINMNKEASRILDLNDGLTVTRSGRFLLHRSEQTAQLTEFVACANRLLSGDIRPNSDRSLMSSTRPSGEFDYLFSVWPVEDKTAELEKGLRCAFVLVIDPNQEGKISTEGLSKLGQLTGAEKAVVDLMAKGFRTSEVAKHRDVSLNTTKTQIRSVLNKLRCSTQSDVIRVAASTRIPLTKPNDVH